MFDSYQLLFLGDFNCRIGTPKSSKDVRYIPNPDMTINTNGARLNKWLSGKELLVLNGYISGSKSFDSNFTFFRGSSRSQNDLVLSNATNIVNSFSILDKEIYSDHSPICATISVQPRCSLNFIQSCSQGTLCDDHWDVNRRKVPSLVFSKVDWPQAIIDLEDKSQSLSDFIQDPGMTNDQLITIITSTIYDTCKANYKRRVEENVPQVHNENCKSVNFKAIADMNLFTYKIHTNNGEDMELRKPYIENFVRYQKLAADAEQEEINTKKNSAWKNAKADGKKMWSLIDWKGRADSKKEVLIEESDIRPYFAKIFQSEKTQHHPKVESIIDQLNSYNVYVPELDDPFEYEELTKAVDKVGTGCGLDGLRSDTIRMLPPSILRCIHSFLQRVFVGAYPKQWEAQILNAVAKDGHSSRDPKLRGIGLAVILARVYDIILDERFKKWYTPNREQAGFRFGQGCPLPLFSIFLLPIP